MLKENKWISEIIGVKGTFKNWVNNKEIWWLQVSSNDEMESITGELVID